MIFLCALLIARTNCACAPLVIICIGALTNGTEVRTAIRAPKPKNCTDFALICCEYSDDSVEYCYWYACRVDNPELVSSLAKIARPEPLKFKVSRMC